MQGLVTTTRRMFVLTVLAHAVSLHADTVQVSTVASTDGHILDTNYIAHVWDGQGDCVFTNPADLDGCLTLSGYGIPFSSIYPGYSEFPHGPLYQYDHEVCVPIPFPPWQICGGPYQGRVWLHLDFPLGSIPDYVTIESAILRLNVTSPGASTSLHHLLIENGVLDAEDFQAAAEELYAELAVVPGLNDLDVTDVIVADYAAGQPWAGFRMELNDVTGGGDPGFVRVGTEIELSESGGANPPTLTVEYTPWPQALVVAPTEVQVPESASNGFTVRLARPPVDPVTVTVSHLAGDPDLSVGSGATLQFDAVNFDQPQVVTLVAADDSDYLWGTATFRVSSPSIPDVDVAAIEADDEPTPTRLYVDQNIVGGDADGSSWSNAFLELRDALFLVNITGGAVQELWIADGTYKPALPGSDRDVSFEIQAPVALYGGFAGGETDVAQRDLVANATILNGDLAGNDGPDFAGDDENCLHVVRTHGVSATFDGLIIEHGNANGSESINYGNRGGGLQKNGGNLVIRNCIFRENFGDEGGGMHNDGPDGAWGSVTLYDSVFRDNHSSSRGGGLFNGAETTSAVYRCTFERNSVSGEFILGGGGMYSTGYSDPLVVDCLFINNDATNGAYGGGMCLKDAAATVINTRFVGNYAQNDGAGVANAGYTRLFYSSQFINCVFAYNHAIGSGGALTNTGLIGADSSLTNCVVWSNGSAKGYESRVQLYDFLGSTAVDYSCVQFGWDGGVGNISDDPLLTGDGHLNLGSPCVDAGDPAFAHPAAPNDVDGEARVLAGRVDIGADEFIDADTDGLPDWWETAYGTGPDDDPDGDGLTESDEYQLGSSPTRGPIYVDDANGDDSWNGRSAIYNPGTGDGPKKTIQSAVDMCLTGDTVRIAAGTYTGPSNRNLDLAGRQIAIIGAAGPEGTVVDCEAASAFAFLDWRATPAIHIGGLRLTNGEVDTYGAISHDTGSAITMRNCVLELPTTGSAGGLRIHQATPRLSRCVLDGTLPSSNEHVVIRGTVHVPDWLLLQNSETAINATTLWGEGAVLLGDGGLFSVDRGYLGGSDLPVSVRCDLYSGVAVPSELNLPFGVGNVHIRGPGRLVVEGDAIVDLGGIDGGALLIEGMLVAQDQATIQNTNINVVLLNLGDGTGVFDNTITLLDETGFGGEFFVAGNASILNNVIVSEGDRYLDFDPDPNASSGLTLAGNEIHVLIREGVGGTQGTLLEMRAIDYDCGPGMANPECGSGVFRVTSSPNGYTDENWVLKRLEIREGAKLNLTNRPGFVYAGTGDPDDPPETVYVEQLVLYPNAVLNTAFQALYYQDLLIVDETGAVLAENPVDPYGPHVNGAEVVEIPLLGFSLKTIAMENDREFEIRVRSRLRDPLDDQPEGPPYLEGDVTREDGLDVNDPDNGLMVMRTEADAALSASSVAAKGAFARAGDEEVVVTFRYRFIRNAAAQLLVHLSDDPDASQSLVELARINPPASGPGSIGSDEWALFYGTFPKGLLNFTRATYAELELRGMDAEVWIDDFDPQIRCPSQCGDFAPPDGLDTEDFLAVLGEYGRTLDPFDQDADKWCLDSTISSDQYIDLSDVFLWDTFLNGEGLNACGSGYTDGARGGAPRGGGTPAILPSTDALVIAGKPTGAVDQRDYLYTVNPDGSELGTALDPASSPDPVKGFRSNTRLIQDGNGRFYQIHGTQGLIRLDTAQVAIPPSSFTVGADQVYLGVTSIGGGDFTGLPLLDVAFHPTDPTIAYVVPVLVVPEETNPDAAICPYKGAAKLQLTEQPGGEFMVDLLKVYGTDPAEDGCVMVTPVLGCQFVLRNPDTQRVREIEIDPSGQNVLVLSAQGLDPNNDWLLVFDESTGDELRMSAGVIQPASTGLGDCPTATGSGVPLPVSPAAMTLSSCGDQLYLTSSLANANPQDARTQVSVLDLQRSGDRIVGLTLNRTIDIDANAVAGPDYGWGHIATVTALAEDPSTCSLYVAGFTAPRVDPYLSTDDPLYEQFFGTGSPIFTTPTLAIVPAGQVAATAGQLVCHDLALPISAVLSVHEPGDCNGDGHVDLDDYAELYGCLSGPAVELAPACECFDLNADNRVDLADVGWLQLLWTAP